MTDVLSNIHLKTRVCQLNFTAVDQVSCVFVCVCVCVCARVFVREREREREIECVSHDVFFLLLFVFFLHICVSRWEMRACR